MSGASEPGAPAPAEAKESKKEEERPSIATIQPFRPLLSYSPLAAQLAETSKELRTGARRVTQESVKLPQDADLTEWLGVNIADCYNDISALVGITVAAYRDDDSTIFEEPFIWAEQYLKDSTQRQASDVLRGLGSVLVSVYQSRWPAVTESKAEPEFDACATRLVLLAREFKLDLGSHDIVLQCKCFPEMRLHPDSIWRRECGRAYSTAVLPDGSIAIAGTNIGLLDCKTKQTRALAGSGQPGWLDGPADKARFDKPFGMAADEKGNVYVADTFNHCIRMISTAKTVSTVAGYPGKRGRKDGEADRALFWFPHGICYRNGLLYIADQWNHTIRCLDLGKKRVSTVAGSSRGHKDGALEEAKFNQPGGMCFDSAGNSLLLADTDNNRVRQVNLDRGRVTTLAGDGQRQSLDGLAVLASLAQPRSVCLDASGNIFISEETPFRVRFLNRKSGLLTTVPDLQAETLQYAGAQLFAVGLTGLVSGALSFSPHPEPAPVVHAPLDGPGPETKRLAGLSDLDRPLPEEVKAISMLQPALQPSTAQAELRALFARVGLAPFAEAFLAARAIVSDFPDLEDGDIDSFIPQLGPRLRFKRYVKHGFPASVPPAEQQAAELKKLFSELHLTEDLPAFEKEQLAVQQLHELSEGALERLIPAKIPRNRLKKWLADRPVAQPAEVKRVGGKVDQANAAATPAHVMLGQAQGVAPAPPETSRTVDSKAGNSALDDEQPGSGL